MKRDEFNHQVAMLPCEPLWGIPVIRAAKFSIKNIKLMPYHQPTDVASECFAHFFIADDHFSGMWRNPIGAFPRIKRFYGALSPDFSTPWDWPRVDQLFNVRRNRFFGAYWQFKGIEVIPTISWGDEGSYGFCFLGVEKHSAVAISTLGVMRNQYFTKLFMSGFNEMVRQLEPSSILVYGRKIKDIGASCEIFYAEPYDTKWQNQE